jgi:hypothetical protein
MTLAQLADCWQTLTLAAVQAVVGQLEPEPHPEPSLADPWDGILPEPHPEPSLADPWDGILPEPLENIPATTTEVDS